MNALKEERKGKQKKINLQTQLKSKPSNLSTDEYACSVSFALTTFYGFCVHLNERSVDVMVVVVVVAFYGHTKPRIRDTYIITE